MNKIERQEFVVNGDKVFVREIIEKEVSDFGYVYLCQNKEDVGNEDKEHLVFKLCKLYGEYFWAGLWNSCVISGPRNKRGDYLKSFKSIDEAIKWALEDNKVVIKTNFSKVFGAVSYEFEKYQ